MILDHPQLLPYQLRVSPYTYLYGPLLIYSCSLPLQQVMGPVITH